MVKNNYRNNTAALTKSVFYTTVLFVLALLITHTTAFAQPTLSLPTATTVTNTTAILGGTVDTGTGITERGTVWLVGSAPTILNNQLAEGGTTTGIFTDTRTGFTPKSHIFYTPYAIDGGGTTLGPNASFYTLANEPGLIASFTSGAQTSTTIDLTWSASAGAAGYLVYINTGSTAPTPILADGAAPTGSPIVNQAGLTHTETGLTRYTQYSFTVIPYDWNGSEVTTYNYGTPQTLTSVFTLETAPVLIAPTASSITNNSAILGGNVTDVGGNTLTEKGTVWNTSSPVTITDNKTIRSGLTVGIFTHTRSSLPPKTQIFYAPYAINAVATTIGPESDFYTVGNIPGSISSFTSPTQTASTIDLNWSTSSNATGYLIYINTGSTAPSPILTDGTAPTGSPVANVGAITSTTITALAATTEYSFTIIPYDWDGANAATYNYRGGALRTLTSEFTSCLAPTLQASAITFSNITAGTVDINWTVGNGNGTLIIAKRNTSVSQSPTNGTAYTANLEFSLGHNLGSTNYIVYNGHASGQTITGLNSNTTYHFAMYEFNTTDNCYYFTGAPTANVTTLAANSTSTITLGSGPTGISSIIDTNGEKITVFSFTMTDLGDDGQDTEFTQMIFRPGAGNNITDWSQVIENAELFDNETGTTVTHGTAIIGTNSITIPAMQSHNRVGEIDEGETKTYELKIYLKSDLGTLQSSIDGNRFVFDIQETDFTYLSGGFTTFAPGQNTNSDAVGAPNNTIEVIATSIVYTTQPSAIATAAVALVQQPILEARDANNNIDLDFNESITVTTPDATLNPASALANFASGYADFAASGFNLQNTGSSSIRVTTSPSSLIANSSPNTVVSASTTVTEITGGIATSPLNSGSTNNALLGFNLTTTGSTLNFTGGVITASSDPDGKIVNVQLYRSTDADYATAGDNSLVAGAIITTPTASVISITGITESIDGAATNNFFIVAEVEGNVFASTPTLQLSLANITDLLVSEGNIVGSSFVGDVFSFADVTAPLINSITSSISTISDSDNGGQILITITYNESMDGATAPTISFPVENPLSTLTLSASSNWATSTQYQAIYDIIDANETIANIDVEVAGGQDIAGNTQLTDASNTNVFSIDTENPLVTGVTLTAPIIDTKTVVNESVSPTVNFVISFNENMQGASTPVISFPVEDALTNGLTFSSGSWTSATEYTLIYNTTDLNVVLNNIDISITGANDAFGNLITTYNEANLFDINTANPTATLITISANPITDNEVGTETVSITVDFSEPMIDDGSQNPAITFTPNISTEMTEAPTAANWPTSQQYVAQYNVVDNDVKIVDIDITVSGGQNVTALNPVTNFTSVDAFDLITQSPQVDNVTALVTTGYYMAGELIDITVQFDQDVTVAGGTPTLTLNTGAVVNFSSMLDTKTLVFAYTVQAGENTPGTDKLTYTTVNSLSLNGATIQNTSGIDAINTLPVIGGVGSMSDIEALFVDTIEPTTLTLTPADDSFNYQIDGNFIIQFSEDIQITSTGVISIFEASGTLVESYDMATSPAEVTFGTDQLTINMGMDLAASSSFYITIDGSIVLDLAGNQFAGYTTDTEWNFVTFGPPTITSIAPEVGTAVCIGSNVVINGSFLTGTTHVTFTGGQTAFGGDVVVVSDTEVRAVAPTNSLSGTINVRKDASSGNPDVNINSTSSILVGPSSATLLVGSIDNAAVCTSGTLTTSTIKIDIVGGTSNYSIDYNVEGLTSSNNTPITQNPYLASGDDISINPPYPNEDNRYTLVGVTDAHGCTAPTIAPNFYTIHENMRATVEAGGDVLGELEYFLPSGLTFTLNSPTLPIPPSSAGAGGIVWSVPGSSDGSFNNSMILHPNYTIGINDILNNSVLITLTTTGNPAGCDPISDNLAVTFISNATATPEINGGGNQFCWDGSANPIITLAGTVGGGATTGIWERLPNMSDPDNGAYMGFDTGSTPATTTTNLNGTYRFTDFEQTQGSAELTLTPTDGLGGAAESIIIQLINNPSPLFLNPINSVCVGDQLVAYEVSFTAGSSYNWTVPVAGGTTFSGQGTNVIIVNWGSGPTTLGNQVIDVEETSVEGCTGIGSETVIVNDLPTIAFNPDKTNFTTADNIAILTLEDGSGDLLEEGIDGTITFSGAAVYIDSNSDWVFNPQLLTFDDLVPANNIYTISYSFSNLLTCTSFGSDQFTLIDENNSINNLARAYCSYEPKSDALDPILDDPSDVLDSIRIVEDGNFYTELESFNAGLRIEAGDYFFYPSVAALGIESPAISREFNVTYFFHTTSGDLNSKSQLTTVFARPDADFDLLHLSNICSTDGSIDLNPINPISSIAGTNYNFTITSPNPLVGPIIVEHDGDLGDNTTWNNFKFKIDQLIIQDPINGDTFDIVYTYARGNEFGFVCDSTISKKIIIHEQPDKPTTNAPSNDDTYCVVDVDNIPLATITNHLSGPRPSNGGLFVIINAEVRWTNEAGIEVSDNPFFKPTFAQLPNEINRFYVSQQIPGAAGCQSEITEVVFINFSGIGFNIAENCLPSDSSPNAGLLTVVFPQAINPTITTIHWAIEDQDGNTIIEFLNSPHTISTDLDIGLGFNPGSYILKLRIITNIGCDATISKNILLLSTLEVSDTSPYFENFNTSDGNWVSVSATNQTKWEWGIPTGDKVNASISDQAVWKTSLTNTYIANSNTFLYSSCFDISRLSRPMIDLKTFVDADEDDGAVIQFTSSKDLFPEPNWQLLGILNSGEAWYNTRSIIANPGNQSVGQYGWSGENQTEWVSSKHVLDSVVNPNNVIFRIQFKSITKRDSETDELLISDLDGFAIDNIFIGNRTRTVLIENFSSTQQEVATKTENIAIDDFVRITPAVAKIQYHPSLDGDDPVSTSPDADARALYYGISNTPRVAIDGKADNEQIFSAWGETEFSTRALHISPLEIITTVYNSGVDINIKSSIKALVDIPSNFIVHTTILENEILLADLNTTSVPSGETEFNQVVRKMLPSASGKKQETELLQGDSIIIENTWSPNKEFNQNDFTVIVFVQDEVTREIYQTEIITPTVDAVLALDKELEDNGFAAYPNPAHSHITLTFKQVVLKDTKVAIYDQIGQLIYTTVLVKGNSQVELATVNWTPGIYYIQTTLDGAPVHKRIMVQH